MQSAASEIWRDADDLAESLAGQLADEIANADREGRRFVLGCPGGRSLASTYRALGAEVARRGLPTSHVVIAMMDDYLLPDGCGGLHRPDPSEHFSCERFGREQILAVLSAGSPEPMSAEALLLPDPAGPGEYDDLLRRLGGIDVFLLASGASDGHVAFNPPGTPVNAITRVVQLAETTRVDNLSTFPDFGGLDEVPRHGITVGPATIRDLSHKVIMVVTGAHKRTAYRRLAAATGYEPSWPATIFTQVPDHRLLADRTAADPA